MAKAIFGLHTAPRTFELLEEVRALRARVAELERALDEAQAALGEREAERLEDRLLRLDAAAPVPLDTAASVI